MKKLIALVLALAMVLMVGAAFADGVKIEIERDSTFDGQATAGDGNEYKYYKVFSASYTSNTSEGGDASSNGAPGDVTASAEHAAYTATATVAAKLGSWSDSTDPKWTKAEGNEWFTLTPIAGSTNYTVAWDNSAETSAEAQKAAKWLAANAVYESQGTLTFNAETNKWEADGLDKGYYLIVGVNGNNLIAATTDITIKEKNDYPPIDKTQADEDNGTQNNDTRNVAVGDILDYNVKVTIPATAKVNETILVWDKASNGLEYVTDSLTVSANEGNATIDDPATDDVNANWTWSKLITITDGSQGKDVVFSFQMKVTSVALIDSGKTNESGLKYGEEHDWKYESKPDHVEYKTYFAGIEKVDGTDTEIKLKGVEFTLKEGEYEFKVSKPEGKEYYVYDPNGSSTVVTDNDGLIRIRGLDKDKTYTLTETKNPNEGYNMLAEVVTLTLMEDTYTVTTIDNDGTPETTTSSSYDGTTADTYGDVINNQGTVLPSTGGIGTTIFYVLGGLLVIGAAVILVARRKAHD